MSYNNFILQLTQKLSKKALKIDEFDSFLEKSDTFFDDIDLQKELLISNGYPILFCDDFVHFKPMITNLSDQTFCIVDIETSNNTPYNGQIIEIGAIKYKNGKVIQTYSTLVNTTKIPRVIENLTGIKTEDTHNAPNIKKVLEEFKLFLADDVFVAHGVEFDFDFINESFKKYNIGELYNQKICTIELIKKIFKFDRYGLKYLKKYLNIKGLAHHRAYDDALAAKVLLHIALQKLPKDIKTTSELFKLIG